MADNSKINWTDATWNPVTGCTKVSPGCKHCYAEVMTKRLQLMGMEKYAAGFGTVVMHPDTLEIPFGWKKPRKVFVNSMSDLFHEDVTDEFIADVFHTMEMADRHIFQVLTKRPERVATMNDMIDWPANVWMGTSVENGDYRWRIDKLWSTDAKVKFLSLEPLLGALPYLNLDGIDWCIVGGESGKGARLCNPQSGCETSGISALPRLGVPYFFKQWGETCPQGPHRPRCWTGANGTKCRLAVR